MTLSLNHKETPLTQKLNTLFPASALKYGPLVNFPAGTLVIAADGEGLGLLFNESLDERPSRLLILRDWRELHASAGEAVSVDDVFVLAVMGAEISADIKLGATSFNSLSRDTPAGVPILVISDKVLIAGADDPHPLRRRWRACTPDGQFAPFPLRAAVASTWSLRIAVGDDRVDLPISPKPIGVVGTTSGTR